MQEGDEDADVWVEEDDFEADEDDEEEDEEESEIARLRLMDGRHSTQASSEIARLRGHHGICCL